MGIFTDHPTLAPLAFPSFTSLYGTHGAQRGLQNPNDSFPKSSFHLPSGDLKKIHLGYINKQSWVQLTLAVVCIYHKTIVIISQTLPNCLQEERRTMHWRCCKERGALAGLRGEHRHGLACTMLDAKPKVVFHFQEDYISS